MKLTTSLGRQVPRPAVTALAERARDTERAVRELAAQAGELSGAVIRRAGALIRDGGGLVIRAIPYAPFNGDPSEFDQLRFGAMPDDPLYNRPDGLQQMAFLAYRDDRTLALGVVELNASDGQYGQAVVWFDRAGNIIVSEDTNSGRGLARPHIPYPPPQPTNTAQWLTHSPSAGDTSWTSIARCEPDPDNARMAWNVRTIVDAGVTAKYRWCWQLDGGVQAPVLLQADGSDATHTLVGDDPVTGYRFGYWRQLNVPFPAGVMTQRRTTLDLQVSMTAGADGTHVAKASVIALGGDQS